MQKNSTPLKRSIKSPQPKISIFPYNFLSLCLSPLGNTVSSKQNKKNFSSIRNNPKFSEKYPNMVSIKLFGLVSCLFRFNRNIVTLCFAIEPKQPKLTVWKQTKTNQNKPKQPKILGKKYQNMLSITLFLLLFCLFRFNRNTETHSLFRYEPKQPKQTFWFG
jgi:hypothetical protein